MTTIASSTTLAIFDLDGTLTRNDTFLPFLLRNLFKRPSRWLHTPLLLAYVVLFKLGHRQNHELKSRFIRSIFGGLPEQAISRAGLEYSHKVLPCIKPGALKALEKHSADVLVLATASPDAYVTYLGDALGFTHVICTHLAYDANGCVTGELLGGNCYSQSKLLRIQRLLEELHFDGSIIFYTDHHADIPTAGWVKNTIAVNPSKKFMAYAKAHELSVVDWDK